MDDEFAMKKALETLAQFPHEIRLACARLMMQELAAYEREKHPVTATAMGTDGEAVREALFETVRDAVKDNDAKALSVLTGWFLLEADKQTLVRCSYWLEHKDEEPAPEPALKLVKEDDDAGNI